MCYHWCKPQLLIYIYMWLLIRSTAVNGYMCYNWFKPWLLWLCSCNLNWTFRNICSWRRLMKLECNSVLVYLESRLCFEMKKLCVWFWKAYFGSSEEEMEKTCLWTTTFCLSSMETPLRKCEIFYTRKVRIFSNSMMQLCEYQGRDVLHFVPVCYWNWTSRLAKNWNKG